MTEMNLERARTNMIEQQIRPWEVLDPRVLDVFAATPREEFVPPRYRNLAFSDLLIPIGHGQCMMRPIVEGRMLQALAIQSSDSILEIGTGSGFTAACLAGLGREVISVDLFEDFVEAAAARLSRARISNVTLLSGDAVKDWRPDRCFDAIAVTGSLTAVPPAYLRALEPGGRLFAVVGEAPAMEAVLVTRVGPEQWSEESLFETDLPKLLHEEPRSRFVF